ncbi:MAG: phosphatidylglycerophosphatase A [Pseudomonadota bacterium]|nr:phosphatidylglycerophosphatase A [Pseudomonadota bacterium]
MNNLEQPHWRLLLDPGHLIALGLGSGFSPVAPGTVGTLLGIPLAFYIQRFEISYRIIILLIMIMLGIYLCGRCGKLFKNQDHPAIVFDEIAGILIPLTFLPFTIVNVLICFCLFRILDIVKPWPISFFDKSLKGGLGIMADDLVAGLFVLLGIDFVLRYLGEFI